MNGSLFYRVDGGPEFPTTSEFPTKSPTHQREELVFKAHRLVYHSTLGLSVMKKRRRRRREGIASQTQLGRRRARPRAHPTKDVLIFVSLE
jgi:hypothetical protein